MTREPRFASFILTYNRPEALENAIRIVLGQTRPPELLLVVDNGDDETAAQVVKSFDDERLVYERTGENLGSAGGVAFGMRRLHGMGFDWIHSVDDDNPPKTPDTVERMRALIERNDDGRLGAVSAVGSRWDWKTGEYSRLPDDALKGDVVVDVIGGGSQLTVRREVIDEIGTPEPLFFFGFYDPMYCLRMAQIGYRCMVDGDLMREYRMEANRMNFDRKKAIVPKEPAHAIWRRYYVTRNYIFRMTRTFDRPDLARREARKAVFRSLMSWARGPRFGARYTAYQLRGVVDGYRGRLGRQVAPQAKQDP